VTMLSNPEMMLARVVRPRLAVEDEATVPEGEEELIEGEEVAEDGAN